MMENKEKRPNLNNNKQYARYSAMAFQMIAAMLLGTYLGYRLDQLVGTAPFLLIVGLLLGVGLAMYIIIKSISEKS